MSGYQSEAEGFGLAHLKMEGAPIHPDDLEADMTPAFYARQMAAYNDFYYPEKHKDKPE